LEKNHCNDYREKTKYSFWNLIPYRGVYIYNQNNDTSVEDNMGRVHMRSCFFCEHFGKESTGEGVIPVCNSGAKDYEHSRPTVSDFTNCPHFVCKELSADGLFELVKPREPEETDKNDAYLTIKYKDGSKETIYTAESAKELEVMLQFIYDGKTDFMLIHEIGFGNPILRTVSPSNCDIQIMP
jgi:hypothetical protein